MRARFRLVLVVATAASLAMSLAGPAAGGGGHRPTPTSGAAAVVAWNTTATSATAECGITPNGNPLAESRLYAMTQLAVYEAVTALHRGRGGTAFTEAAVAAAAHDTLVPGLTALAPGCVGIAAVETAYTAALQAISDGPAKSAGVGAGQAAAADVAQQRSADGVTATFTWQDQNYPQGTRPGEWRFTPQGPGEPDVNFAFAPSWGTVKPFILRNSNQFNPAKPYGLTSKKYAADVNEVRSLGALTGSTRTPDQTQIALFWVGSSPYQWNNIARNLLTDNRLDAVATAKLFAVMNMAMADGYISSFATKYRYDFWRPVTAIRLADTDGNPATTADPGWYPLVSTPPIPDYDSAHAVEGAAAATVLEGFLGRRGSDFSVCSLTLTDPAQQCGGTAEVLRHFGSPTQAAAENGLSRIYIGFHFRNAVDKGIEHGTSIGRYALATALRAGR